jgi:parallel beta-helix repeat protein
MGNMFLNTNGIDLLNSDNNTIWSNNFNGDNSGGIKLTNSSNNIIYGNNISRIMDANGICLSYDSVNNFISGNIIEDNCGYGIYVSIIPVPRFMETKLKIMEFT